MSFRSTLALLKNAAVHLHHAPNAPLELDPALSRLLHDTDLSLLRKFRHGSKHYVERAELEIESEPNAFENTPPEFEGYEVVERGFVEQNSEGVGIWDGPKEERRSPAAIYGTKHLGMVTLPWELEHAVEKVVGESDKHQLRSDAKRLFFYPTPSNTRPTSSSSSSSPSKTPRDLTGLQTSNRPSEWQLSAPNASSLSFSIKGNYKTAIHLGPREGLAFATVAMPAHYAATANVFREIAQRMAGPGQGEDRIEAVVDFGGKSGQGLWASLVAFREPVSPPEVDPLSSPSSDKNANPESWTPISASPHHPRVGISSTPSFYEPSSPNSALKSADSDDPEDIVGGENWTASTVKKYTLLDSRRGMTELARRFVKGTELGGCEILYQDFWGKNTQLTAPERSLALCAFTLSELPNGTSRKRMVTEMWDSGAEWMVVIDHGTPTGFDSVAHARELLLELGRRGLEARANNPSSELDAPRLGSHVVAPCPHSHACPLHNSPHTRDVCHFTQRIQTPPFLRHTKHSHEGHEDVAYSYVVVRRGQAPSTHVNQQYGSPIAKGLVGAIGREEAEKIRLDLEQGKPKQKGRRKDRKPRGRTVLEMGDDGVWDSLDPDLPNASQSPLSESAPPYDKEHISEESAMRSAIGTWPRIVYPPMKRSGHVILDTCTREGSIARITIPKSQGKQAYYDARKANWGDAFPHAPRIVPKVRTRGIRRLGPFVPNDEAGKDNATKQTKDKERSKGKSLREARSYDEDVDSEDWINAEAGKLALEIQMQMEKEGAEREHRPPQS